MTAKPPPAKALRDQQEYDSIDEPEETDSKSRRFPLRHRPRGIILIDRMESLLKAKEG